jgi:hypothetical protein
MAHRVRLPNVVRFDVSARRHVIFNYGERVGPQNGSEDQIHIYEIHLFLKIQTRFGNCALTSSDP